MLIENAIDYGPPGQRITLHGSPGRLEVDRRRPGPRPGRGGDDLRPLPPRHGRPRVPSQGHGARAADRPRARLALARHRDPGQRRRRRRDGDDPPAARRRHDPERDPRGRCRMTGWRRNLAIAVAAVAGLLVAAALTTAASSLSGQSVGPLLRAADRGTQPRARSRPPRPTPTRPSHPHRDAAAQTHPHAASDRDAHPHRRPHRGADRRRRQLGLRRRRRRLLRPRPRPGPRARRRRRLKS